MKKHEGVTKRVRAVEEKYGIKYAKTSGKLYKVLKVMYILLFIYTTGINLLFLAGELLMYAGTDKFKYVANSVITVSVCTFLLVAGLVFICTRLKFTGGIISVISSVFLAITFSTIMKDDLGHFGYKLSFYWRHFVPLVLLVILVVWLTIITVTERRIFNRCYKKVTENLYAQYHVEGSGITDEQWEEFLKNYDPNNYKRQFSVQETNSDEATTNQDK